MLVDLYFDDIWGASKENGLKKGPKFLRWD